MRKPASHRTPPAILALALLLLAGAIAPAPAWAARAIVPPLPHGAQASSAIDETGAPRVEVQLLVETSDILYDEPFRAGLLFDISPGWHIYWRDPGASGLATRIDWSFDEAEIGPIHWPDPEVFRDSAPGGGNVIETFGYSGQVLLASHILPRATFEGPVQLRAKAHFIACKISCIPGEVQLERTLMLGAGMPSGERRETPLTALFDAFQAGGGEEAMPGPPPHGRETAARSTSSIGLLRAFLLALLGGLILNAMPCVLPVLAIKTVGIAEIARESRTRVAVHGLAYTGGILCSMWILAALVLGLRAAGIAVGWGFQFQDPVFLAAISIVLLLFALNLFGIWEITPSFSRLATVGSESKGLRRSFFDGFLAVTLATPCSAPFLGTAVGFAFAGGALEIGVIFSSIGLGLALPFALISMVPGWARWMPRSGPWMTRLRSVLGFALLATMAWLLWLLGGAGGNDLLGLVLALLVVVASWAWALGQLQLSGRTIAVRATAVALALGILICLTALALGPVAERPPPASVARASGGLDWQTFDRSRIDADLAKQRAVFVYFTADWCITCKLNERLVLSSSEVLAELERLEFATYRGDWTRRDPAIHEELQRYGKAGVPVYVVYGPGRPFDDPLILPELLTVETLIDALRAVAAPASGESRLTRRAAID